MIEPLNPRGGKNFIDEGFISGLLAGSRPPEKARVKDIIQKSLAVETLSPEETALLLSVTETPVWNEMFEAAAQVKRKVYDNRVVVFAPLYCSNLCVNNCLYCGFRSENKAIVRRRLGMDEIRREAAALALGPGHKRLILVCGEHPSTGADYITEAIKTVYSAGEGGKKIRRVNVNAAPMETDDLKKLKSAGIGTFQVFQETYHPQTYAKLHPAGTPKSDFSRRLYSLHAAQKAGIDDVAIGALFGLYDWRFEVLAMVCHARDLERTFGIGPHTVSFPRLEPAANTPFAAESGHLVSDGDFKKLVCALRLSIPYAGMIVTARERPEVIRSVMAMCTQRDASSRIGIGAYSDRYDEQEAERQQFLLGDTRSLEEVVGELAEMGYITSFCTAGYRCGRTGGHIMEMLRSGKEGKLCKLNAALTFREWLDDFAGAETKKAGEKLLERELSEIRSGDCGKETLSAFCGYYDRVSSGERDLGF